MIDSKKLSNIQRLSVDDCLIIMHECAERIGLSEWEDYRNVHGNSKRDIYKKVKSGEIKSFSIGKRKFPCINT